MRRSSTRRTWVLLHPATGVAGAATVNKATAKEQEKIDGFFNQYADKAEDHCIGPEGIEALCEDLGVPPTDVRILLLAWKLQAARQGYFSLEEWRKGLKSMRVDSLDKLRKALPSLQQEMVSPYNFKDFYTFSFKYCLTALTIKNTDNILIMSKD
uniref:Defective in cullin neddylation protein n=1 Tax=Physcomitrium patens TaxID=3218 RepID=A0A7I4D2D4_PHYPA